MEGYLSIVRISQCIYLHLPLASINKLRCPDAGNFNTLPPKLSKSLANEKKLLHNVNVFNSFHIFINNSFKYLFYIYIYMHLDS